VLTIHRSKGLEWDVVLLPGLHRRLRGDDRPLLSWIELPRPDRDADLLMAALSIGRNRDDDRLGAYIAQLRKQRQKHERCRLAYVAATRAREELHLFAFASVNKDGHPQARANSMLKTFWPALGPYFEARTRATSDSVAQPEGASDADCLPAVEPTDCRLDANWSAPTPPPLPRVPRFEVGAEVDAVLKPDYLWAGQRRRAIGTVVHAELERLALGAGNDPAVRPAAWRLQLRELGLAPEQLERAVADVALVIAGLADDANARWILSDAHDEAASELRLSGIVAGQLRDIVVDRTFVDGGARWVIDYKTGTHQGADLEGFLAAELERYRPQLELYRTVVAGLGPQPVRVALYFPLLRRLVELPG
jgi:ATP-dependent helicase/nuclease subunit A